MSGRDPSSAPKDVWECTECGEQNPLDEYYCYSCGCDQDGTSPPFQGEKGEEDE